MSSPLSVKDQRSGRLGSALSSRHGPHSAWREVHSDGSMGKKVRGQRSEVPTECGGGSGPWGGLSQEVALGSGPAALKGTSIPAKVTGQEVAPSLAG